MMTARVITTIHDCGGLRSRSRGVMSLAVIMRRGRSSCFADPLLFLCLECLARTVTGQWSMLAGFGDQRLVHTTGVEPLGGQFDAFAQLNFWLKAKFASSYLDAMHVIEAEHHGSQLCHNRFGVGEGSYNSLGHIGTIVDRNVGQV